MNRSEIFYFDVDGTLLDNATHTVPESTLEALNELKSKGYLVALCTGRTLVGIQEAGVDKLIDWDGYVLANGSLILDKNMNVIKEVVMDPKWVQTLVKHNPGPLLIEGERNFLTGEPNDRLHAALEHFKIPEVYPVETYIDQKAYNIITYNFDTFPEDLKETFFEDIDIVFDQLGNSELILKASGKHNGVQTLNKHLNVSLYSGFGDGHNDVDFLKNANYSVAMMNGCFEVKEVATFTTLAVADNGIAHALKYFGVL